MVQSIERGIEILNLLKSGPLGVTELARATDLPKTTVHRLLKTFEAHHWVELNGALKKYQLSWGVLPMAKSFLMSLDVRAIAQPYMVAIRDQLQQYLPFTVLKLICTTIHLLKEFSCNSIYRLRYATKGARQQRSKATMRTAHL